MCERISGWGAVTHAALVPAKQTAEAQFNLLISVGVTPPSPQRSDQSHAFCVTAVQGSDLSCVFVQR